jgi:hypothetical protein
VRSIAAISCCLPKSAEPLSSSVRADALDLAAADQIQGDSAAATISLAAEAPAVPSFPVGGARVARRTDFQNHRVRTDMAVRRSAKGRRQSGTSPTVAHPRRKWFLVGRENFCAFPLNQRWAPSFVYEVKRAGSNAIPGRNCWPARGLARGGNASGQKRSRRASLAATLRGQGGGRVVEGRDPPAGPKPLTARRSKQKPSICSRGRATGASRNPPSEA